MVQRRDETTANDWKNRPTDMEQIISIRGFSWTLDDDY
jgi:hypothetical protein